MRIVAMEEAFSVPEVVPPAPPGLMAIRPEFLREWDRRMPEIGALRLADMDAHGVDVQVLSHTTPGVEAIREGPAAVRAAARLNDVLAGAVADHPTRFAGLAALPLQDPQAAVRELRRAVGELGLHGALVNDHTQGHFLDEPAFRPLWAALEELGVTLYLHPGVIPTEPWKVFEGHGALAGPTWGWTARTGAHALRIIYGAVFDDFPGASLTLGHMGELLPFQASRLDSRYRQAMPERPLAHAPSDYLRTNVFATTSGVASHAALVAATTTVGIERVLFAVDYPYESTQEAVDFLSSAPFAPADLARIASGNADRLLRLTP